MRRSRAIRVLGHDWLRLSAKNRLMRYELGILRSGFENAGGPPFARSVDSYSWIAVVGTENRDGTCGLRVDLLGRGQIPFAMSERIAWTSAFSPRSPIGKRDRSALCQQLNSKALSCRLSLLIFYGKLSYGGGGGVGGWTGLKRFCNVWGRAEEGSVRRLLKAG